MMGVRGVSGRILQTLWVCALAWGLQGTAQADQRVVFTSGETLAIQEFHLDRGLVVLRLVGGGELGCRPSQIARFERWEGRERVLPGPAEGTATSTPSSEPDPVFSPSNPEPGVRRMIEKISRQWRVDPKLVEAVVRVESNFDPYAVSYKGAMGLMQLMPQTAKLYRVENVFDPGENLVGGIRHLKGLLDRYGETPLALAAYNAGEGAVAKAGGIPPYRETRAYVGRIMTLIQP